MLMKYSCSPYVKFDDENNEFAVLDTWTAKLQTIVPGKNWEIIARWESPNREDAEKNLSRHLKDMAKAGRKFTRLYRNSGKFCETIEWLEE